MANMNTKYFAGKGCLLAGEVKADGSIDVYDYYGDVESIGVQMNVTRQKVIENHSGNNGLGAGWQTEATGTLNIVMRSVQPEHLVFTFQGARTSQAAATGVNQAGVAKNGKLIKLNHIGATVTAVTQGATPAVLDTDYKVYPNVDAIEIITGGVFNEDDAVTITYDHPDQDIVTSTPQSKEWGLIYEGLNLADSSRRVRCTIDKCQPDPGFFDFMSDQHATAPISAEFAPADFDWRTVTA